MNVLRTISFLLVVIPSCLLAQDGATPLPPSATGGPGSIAVHSPSAVDSLERVTRGRTELRGYRIQIFLGSANEAKSTRQKFMGLGLGQPAYMVQNIPSYAVRVGDFLTLLDAHRALAEVKKHYPGAFVVQDAIGAPKFIKP